MDQRQHKDKLVCAVILWNSVYKEAQSLLVRTGKKNRTYIGDGVIHTVLHDHFEHICCELYSCFKYKSKYLNFGPSKWCTRTALCQQQRILRQLLYEGAGMWREEEKGNLHLADWVTVSAATTQILYTCAPVYICVYVRVHTQEKSSLSSSMMTQSRQTKLREEEIPKATLIYPACLICM